MLNLAGGFLGLARMASGAFGAPFWAGEIVDADVATYDDGGSIVTPAMPVRRSCTVQIDQATDFMRAQEGYSDGEVRFIILSASFTGVIDTDARVEVANGPHAGAWLVSSLQLDPAAIGYVGKGRKAA